MQRMDAMQRMEQNENELKGGGGVEMSGEKTDHAEARTSQATQH